MRTVAIICEYNPFHNGHKYQIERVRDILGEDVCVIAIMSGNYTQRADVAIADKSVRAVSAVDEGVDLVLELPFPYSMASAEFFAEAGVSIADAVGADYLAFGAESGDISVLNGYADLMLDESYKERFDSLDATGADGYAKICEKASLELAKEQGLPPISFTPNNILALEYLKA